MRLLRRNNSQFYRPGCRSSHLGWIDSLLFPALTATDPLPMAISALDTLALTISRCRLCDAHGLAVAHLPVQHRGVTARILVVAHQPDKHDLRQDRPLTGPAGNRVMDWFAQIGLGSTRDELLQRCFFTTLVKCHVPGNRSTRRASHLCFGFIEQEIRLIKPRLCITLGPEPLAMLFKCSIPLDKLVGKLWQEEQLGIDLFRSLPSDCLIAPLPSPSPSSRWLHQVGNKKRLAQAISNLASAAPRLVA